MHRRSRALRRRTNPREAGGRQVAAPRHQTRPRPTGPPQTESMTEARLRPSAVPLAPGSIRFPNSLASFAALRQVSVDLEPGRCYVLIGENGAGKSTLLRILAGLLRPTHGKVTVFGAARAARSARPHRLHEPRAHALRRADRPGKSALLRQSLSWPACLDPLRRCARWDSIRDLHRTLGQYSQGMRQRTSLARVLLPVPELLLLDEPFSNMDVESVRQMVELLAGFAMQPHHRDHNAPARAGRAHCRLGARAACRPRGLV